MWYSVFPSHDPALVPVVRSRCPTRRNREKKEKKKKLYSQQETCRLPVQGYALPRKTLIPPSLIVEARSRLDVPPLLLCLTFHPLLPNPCKFATPSTIKVTASTSGLARPRAAPEHASRYPFDP
ncbi:hypothetical protein IF2G_02008 [Cordyceps javanica]|nr:hypothetical protein IF2G_02008 [Cordyceps javanica]